MASDRDLRRAERVPGWPRGLRVLRKPIALGQISLVLTLAVSIGAPTPGLAAAHPGSSSLVLAGCAANVPVTRLLLRAFAVTRPEVAFEVSAVGSTAGLAMARAGTVHIGLVSRPGSTDEHTREIAYRPYATTAIVLGADPAVRDVNLTTDDVRRIYRGTRTRWADGRRIALLTREQGDSSIASLRAVLPGFSRAYDDGAETSHWTVLYSEPAMHEALFTVPFALGLSDLGMITIERLPLKALSINGVAPTFETLASGRYPLTKTLGFVWRRDHLPPVAQRFIDFVGSDEGASILTAHGYVPTR